MTAGWLMKKGEGVLAGYKRRCVACAQPRGMVQCRCRRGQLPPPLPRCRYVVLDNGVMSYYKSIDDYESGQPPLKGNRIKIQDYTCKAVASALSPLLNGLASSPRAWHPRLPSLSQLRQVSFSCAPTLPRQGVVCGTSRPAASKPGMLGWKPFTMRGPRSDAVGCRVFTGMTGSSKLLSRRGSWAGDWMFVCA